MDWNRFVAFLIVLGYMTLVPLFWKHNWGNVFNLFGGDWKWIYLGLMAAGNLSIFIGGGLFFYLLYTKKITRFEKYRIQFKKDWPWESTQNLPEWKKFYDKTVQNNLANLLTGVLTIQVDFYVWEHELKYSVQELPSLWENFAVILVCAIFHDTLNYWIHRLLHHPIIYPALHKIHHQYYQPISISSQYFHPLEFVTAFLIPGIAGRKFLYTFFGFRMHFLTFWLWMCMGVFIAFEAHCGYEFPYSPMNLSEYLVQPAYHDFHHSHNIGTYASIFIFWDSISGGNQDYFKYRQQQLKLQESLKSQ